MIDLNTLQTVAPLVVIFLVRKFFDTNDPETVNGFRLFFAGGQIFLLSTLFMIHSAIKSNPKGKDKLTVTESDLKAKSALADLIKSQTGAAASTAKEEKRTMTVEEYDQQMFMARAQQIGVVLFLIPCLHLYFGLVSPLAMSTTMNTLGLLADPIAQVHLFGKDLRRPFVTPESPFSSMFQGLNQQAQGQKKVAESQAAVVQTKVADKSKTSQVTSKRKSKKSRKE